MASLNVPEFREDGCDFLRVTVSEILSPSEVGDLRKLLGVAADTEIRVRAQRIAKSKAGDASLREVLVVHAVTPDEAKAESAEMREEDPDYPAADAIGAHLVLELSFDAIEPVEVGESDQSSVDRALAWLRAARKDLEASIVAGRVFSKDSFEPVMPMPEPPKPFTAVRGLILARESDEPTPGAVVYEVHVRQAGDAIPVAVSYRGRFSGGDDALEKIVQQASEIMLFGVRQKLVTGEHVAKA